MATFSDILLNPSAGNTNLWVGMINNATSVAYKATALTSAKGLFTITAPAGIYTVYTSVSGTGLPTGGDWIATGDAAFLITDPVDMTTVGAANTNDSFPSGFISRDAAHSGVGIIVKPLGDGTSGLIDWIIDDTTGYLLHFHTGPNAGSSAACIGIGVDNGAQGLLVNNKLSGNGIFLQNSNTITGATAYGLYGRQFSNTAPLIHLDQNTSTDKPLLSMWGNPTAAARIAEWFTDAGTTTAGFIAGVGTLVAGSPIVAPTAGMQFLVAGSFAEQVWEFDNYGVDLRRWRLTASGTNNEIYLSAINDAMNSETIVLTFTRAGNLRTGGTVQATGQLYPGAEALGQQSTGGLLHSTGVPANTNGNNNDWAISDNQQLFYKVGGAWAPATFLSASISAASAGINSTETQVVGITLPANIMRAGSQFRITASGVCTSTVANASHFRARIGTTSLSGNIAVDVSPTAAASGTGIPFLVDILVTVRTSGASGSVIGSGVLSNNGVTGVSAATPVVAQTTATVALDTTAQKVLELTYQAAASTTTCTFHNASIEQVKA